MAEKTLAKTNVGDVKSLFKAAMACDGKVDAARAALEKAIEERSEAVKKVFEANGNDNGPFNYQGQIYTIRHRAPKDEDGKPKEGSSETWFFVTVGGSDLTNIE